jgi:hypothetical protein
MTATRAKVRVLVSGNEDNTLKCLIVDSRRYELRRRVALAADVIVVVRISGKNVVTFIRFLLRGQQPCAHPV